MSLPRVQSRALEAERASRPPGETEAGAGKRLHVVTFGCQMNKYDSERVEGRLRRHGWSTTGVLEEADLVLFNTCSVRDHAEERVHSWVGELKRAKERRPELLIGVMGCMAERLGGELFKRSGHVDLVVGTRSFQHLPGLVDELRARRADGARPRDSRVVATGFEEPPDGLGIGERAGEPYTGGLQGWLAVMRGCDLNCTFCIVPAVRGRVLSRPIEQLVDEARWMVDGGARAITLLGQTVNSYGEDLPVPGPGEARGSGRRGRPALADLIRALQELDGLERIRLITLHPAYVTDELAAAIRDCDKLDRFLPLPAQSGSDRVLKAMKRGYTTDLYRRRVELLRARVPDIELGSDWIVGFPGETDEDFEATEHFLAELGTVVNYVFKYDPRPGTRADGLADDVRTAVKKERNRRLLEVGERAALERMRRHVGRPVRCFVEESGEDGLARGRTVHGLPVRFPNGNARVGTTVAVVPRDASPYGLAGELARPGSS